MRQPRNNKNISTGLLSQGLLSKIAVMNRSLGTFYIFGGFSNSHRHNSSPHPTNKVGSMFPEFFSEFQLCIGWGEGELQENFKKDVVY